MTANQPQASYWATTTICWRNAGPKGFAYLKFGDSAPPTEADLLPEHPAFDDAEAGQMQDAMLFTKNVSAYPTSNVLSVSL